MTKSFVSLLILVLTAAPTARAFDFESNRRDSLLARCTAALINLTHGADLATPPAPTEVLGAFDIPKPSIASMLFGMANAPTVGPLAGEGWRHPWRRWRRAKRLTHVPPVENDDVPREVRVYRGQVEIEGFLDRQAEFTAALDQRVNQHLRSARTPRRVLKSAVQGLVAVGAVVALIHYDFARAWLLVPAPFVAFFGLDVLGAARDSARAWLEWARPVDRKARALDRSFAWVRNDLAAPTTRPVHFGVSTWVGTQFDEAVTRAASPDLVSDDVIIAEMNRRVWPGALPSRLVVLDFLYSPRDQDERPALMVMKRTISMSERRRP